MLEAGLSQRHVAGIIAGCTRALLQECGNAFELTEMSGIGMMVVVRRSQLNVKIDLLSPRAILALCYCSRHAR